MGLSDQGVGIHIALEHLDGQVVDPLRHQVVHWSSAPLWCHVSNTSYGGEIETTFVLFDEALNFTSLDPGNPWFGHVPAELLDPLDGAECGHCTVGVAREVEHLDVWLVSHYAVDPEGTLVLLVPVLVYLVVALHPGGVLVVVEVWVDVEDVLDGLVVEVVRDSVAKDVLVLHFTLLACHYCWVVLKPFADVISERESSLVSGFTTILQEIFAN